MPLEGKTVAILAEDLFEDIELLYPYYRLLEEGARVLVVGSSGTQTYHGKHGIPAQVDVQASELDPATVDAVIVPGGYAPDRMRRHRDMLDLVRSVFDQGKLVASICHAPWVPISAGIVRGKRMTSVSSVRDDLVNAGAQWVDEEVVEDGNLISSRGPRDLPAFCRAIIRHLSR
ncbi:MAG: type 1 glutamine amidotransferase [Anaerolineae bacterium]|nr:type 1 glutamine amidotransferase [Anaerolineae bacterium]